MVDGISKRLHYIGERNLVDKCIHIHLLNIVDEESMRLRIISVIVVALGRNFRPIVRHYEVGELQSHAIVKLV